MDTMDNSSIKDMEEHQKGAKNKNKLEVKGKKQHKGKEVVEIEDEDGKEESDHSMEDGSNTKMIDGPLKLTDIEKETQDVEKDEHIENSNYRSIFSEGSMVNKMENMDVRKDEMPITGSGKRKNAETEIDSTSSLMKGSKNVH